MRRTVAIIAGPVIAALATGAILAVSGAAQTPSGSTIKLVTKNCTYKLIDIPPRIRGRNPEPGAGDGSAGSCQVFNASGGRAGAFDAACVFPKGVRRGGAALCKGAYSLAGGDLHVAARVEEDTVSGSIVGGTRTYAGARGTFTSIERPQDQERNGYPKDDTITLLP
jgi:hypothetical protein